MLCRSRAFFVIQFRLEAKSKSGNFDEVGGFFDPKA